MSKRLVEQSLSSIETTIGELIEAVTEFALQAGKTEREAYVLASLAIDDLLASRRHKGNKEFRISYI